MTDASSVTPDWDQLAEYAEDAARSIAALDHLALVAAIDLNAAGIHPTQTNADSGMPSVARRFISAYNAMLAAALNVQNSVQSLQYYVHNDQPIQSERDQDSESTLLDALSVGEINDDGDPERTWSQPAAN